MQVVVKPSETAAELSVSEVNKRVRGRIEGATDLRGLWIRGEISNVRLGGTGHLYFTLKDASSQVRGFMNERDELFLTFDGQSGLQIEADDEITVGRADTPLRLIKPSTRSYFEVLRTKLKWGER